MLLLYLRWSWWRLNDSIQRFSLPLLQGCDVNKKAAPAQGSRLNFSLIFYTNKLVFVQKSLICTGNFTCNTGFDVMKFRDICDDFVAGIVRNMKESSNLCQLSIPCTLLAVISLYIANSSSLLPIKLMYLSYSLQLFIPKIGSASKVFVSMAKKN